MKGSEMRNLLLRGLCDLGQWYELPPEQVASALSLLLKPENGWDPEEPELPKMQLAPADVVTKTRRGETVHYLIGPVRASRAEAEADFSRWEGAGRDGVVGNFEAECVDPEEEGGAADLRQRIEAALTEVRSASPRLDRIEEILEGGALWQ